MIVEAIKRRIKSNQKGKEWRSRNQNNGTTNSNCFCFDNVRVGDYTYGPLTVLDFGTDYTLTIGACCSIASGVVFNLAGDHPLQRVSSFPFKAKALGGELTEATSKGDIIVDDDVWIGQNAIILSGVHIGQGAVIAAGAIVTKDVPAYAIVCGVPAKMIKKRFSDDVIDYLLTLDYKNLNITLIRNHIEELYKSIDEMTLIEIQDMFSWFPKRLAR